MVPIDRIENRIFLIRGERVIVDTVLAEFYGVSTKRLNEQVRRNIDRFPQDFVFRLDAAEKHEVVANCDHLCKLKFSSVLPFVFSEHGAIMAATVLNSRRAVEMSVYVVRAFVNLRRDLAEHIEIKRKIDHLEKSLMAHDEQLVAIVRAIKTMLGPEKVPKKRQIGF